MKKLIESLIFFLIRFLSDKFVLKLELFLSRSLGKGMRENLESEVRTCIKLLKDKPLVFLDVGANKGNYTSQVLAYYKDLESYLFEPSSFNIDCLTKKFSDKRNITIVPSALSNYSGTGKLYSENPGSGTASMTKRDLSFLQTEFSYEDEIKVTTLKKFWKENINHEYIDYMKIDVEGHEMDVLEGCGEMISNIKLIQFEFGGTHIDTRIFFKDFWDYFITNNFSLYRLAPKRIIKIEGYNTNLEIFSTTNYIATNNLI